MQGMTCSDRPSVLEESRRFSTSPRLPRSYVSCSYLIFLNSVLCALETSPGFGTSCNCRLLPLFEEMSRSLKAVEDEPCKSPSRQYFFWSARDIEQQRN